MSVGNERPKFASFEDEIAWGMDISPTSRRQREAYIILERGLGRLSLLREYVAGILASDDTPDPLDWKGDYESKIGKNTTLTMSRDYTTGKLDPDHFRVQTTEDGLQSIHRHGIWVGRDFCQIIEGWSGGSTPYWPRELLEENGLLQHAALRGFDANMTLADGLSLRESTV